MNTSSTSMPCSTVVTVSNADVITFCIITSKSLMQARNLEDMNKISTHLIDFHQHYNVALSYDDNNNTLYNNTDNKFVILIKITKINLNMLNKIN